MVDIDRMRTEIIINMMMKMKRIKTNRMKKKMTIINNMMITKRMKINSNNINKKMKITNKTRKIIIVNSNNTITIKIGKAIRIIMFNMIMRIKKKNIRIIIMIILKIIIKIIASTPAQ